MLMTLCDLSCHAWLEKQSFHSLLVFLFSLFVGAVGSLSVVLMSTSILEDSLLKKNNDPLSCIAKQFDRSFLSKSRNRILDVLCRKDDSFVLEKMSVCTKLFFKTSISVSDGDYSFDLHRKLLLFQLKIRSKMIER
jgi:hypothetical protein